MTARTLLSTLLVCYLLSAPALAQTTRDVARGPRGPVPAAAGARRLVPAAAGTRLHYIRVPKTGSSSLKRHLLACDAVRYHDHKLGCLIPYEQCNSTQVHAKQPKAIVFGVIRSPCEHFDSVHRHLISHRWGYMPNGPKTTPMHLARTVIALRRSSAVAGSPALALQAFARSIPRKYPGAHHVMLLPQAYYLPDAPWSRPVCYSNDTTVLAQQVNRVFADAGVGCRIRPQALGFANVNTVLSPRVLPWNVCRVVTEELYPEDAALFDKHCSPNALRRALQ
jgi:hypothetical protein